MSNKYTSVYDWLKYIKANVVGINLRELRVNCCTGKYSTSGKHPETGEKLQWIYYEDYIKEFDASVLTPYRVGA